MMYSVWNARSRRFDYYRTAEVGGVHAPTPRHIPGGGALGATPEEAAWPLPPGAMKVGSGELAVGRIATLGGFAAKQIPTIAVAVLAVMATWYVYKRGVR